MLLFTDWDGTVTLQDSNDLLTDDLGMGQPARRLLNDAIFNGTLTFRDGFAQMLDSVANNNVSIQQCIDYLLPRVRLDPGFKETVEWCASKNIPVVVVSSGMDIVIEALLHNLLPESLWSAVHIYANHVDTEANPWTIKYRDDTSFGHDKNQSIIKATELLNGTRTFYCGDGVSDISASKSCHVLFAKKGMDLHKVCVRDGLDHIEFDSFKNILDVLKEEHAKK